MFPAVATKHKIVYSLRSRSQRAPFFMSVKQFIPFWWIFTEWWNNLRKNKKKWVINRGNFKSNNIKSLCSIKELNLVAMKKFEKFLTSFSLIYQDRHLCLLTTSQLKLQFYFDKFNQTCAKLRNLNSKSSTSFHATITTTTTEKYFYTHR